MREMHRVTFSMALSANMDSAALQRSGDSKAKDAAQIAAILAKVGEIIREGVEVIVKLVGQIRKDTTADNVRVTGAEKFDADSIAAAIEEAVELLNGVPLKSPTFLKRYLYRLYKLALAAGASDKDLDVIRQELDTMITAESLEMMDAGAPGPLDKKNEDGKPGEKDPENNDDPEDDEEQDDKPKAASKPRSRRLYPVA
jgi:hypothetical protein